MTPPSARHIFFVRDAELAQIIKMTSPMRLGHVLPASHFLAQAVMAQLYGNARWFTPLFRGFSDRARKLEDT